MSTRNRNSQQRRRSTILLRMGIAGPILGAVTALLTWDWRWLITGTLLTLATATLTTLLPRPVNTWEISAWLAVPAGLAMWAWSSNSQWLALGLFPLAFVGIHKLSTATEHRNQQQ